MELKLSVLDFYLHDPDGSKALFLFTPHPRFSPETRDCHASSARGVMK
jgi:hypothetical protein